MLRVSTSSSGPVVRTQPYPSSFTQGKALTSRPVGAGRDHQNVVQKPHPVVDGPWNAVMEAVRSSFVRVRAEDGRRVSVEQPPAVHVAEGGLKERVVVLKSGPVVFFGRRGDKP